MTAAMGPLFDIIVTEIEAHGPLDFARYMELALYHPEHGYYTAGRERAGWRGHFITSAEIDPAFGTLLAGAVESVWMGCGAPEIFRLIEIGPGEAGLVKALVDATSPELTAVLEIHLVELSPAVRERQSLRLGLDATWHDSLDDLAGTTSGCVIANEVFDNLPVRVIEMRDRRLLECFVEHRDGALVEVLAEPRDEMPRRFLDRFEIDPIDGSRLEIPLQMEVEIDRVAAAISMGAAIVIDYGFKASELVDRPAGTLVAYSRSGVDHDVLATPGESDITAHVNWTVALEAFRRAGFVTHGPLTQRDVLHRLGARDLDSGLRGDHDAALADGRGADAVAALSRRQALGALVDPGGLGALEVIVATRGIAALDWIPATS